MERKCKVDRNLPGILIAYFLIYVVQGKILYKESEIEKLLEAVHKKCTKEQKWV